MGVFGNSLKRELGKNTGKFISNVVFGDKHSTPYRRVDVRRQTAHSARLEKEEARRRVEEVRTEARLEKERMRREEARERAELERKNQLYAIDSAVIRNIDILNSQAIPSDKQKLLQMLSELSVQMKVNKWETKGDEAAIRNKYTEALLEKYIQCVHELEMMDVNEPRLEYFKNIITKAKRNRFWTKYRGWISILALLVISILHILFLNNPQLLVSLVIIICIILFMWSLAWMFRRYTKQHQKTKSTEAETDNKDSDNTPRKPVSIDESIVDDSDSIFFDLNENGRIEKKLALIWRKYQRLVPSSIMKRKPIFSADGVKDSILYIGINPSYNPEDDNVFIQSDNHLSLMYGSFYQRDDAPEYFKSLEEFASMLGKGYTHINLLYARENDRDALIRSNGDFIREQLELTYETIIKINPVAIIFFSNYCRDMIFGADRWVDPISEKDGHFLLRGTSIPIYFSDDITIVNDVQKMSLIRKIKAVL